MPRLGRSSGRISEDACAGQGEGVLGLTWSTSKILFGTSTGTAGGVELMVHHNRASRSLQSQDLRVPFLLDPDTQHSVRFRSSVRT